MADGSPDPFFDTVDITDLYEVVPYPPVALIFVHLYFQIVQCRMRVAHALHRVHRPLRLIFESKWPVIKRLWADRTRLQNLAQVAFTSADAIEPIILIRPFADLGMLKRDYSQLMHTAAGFNLDVAERDIELVQLLRRLYVALNLTVPVDFTGYSVRGD